MSVMPVPEIIVKGGQDLGGSWGGGKTFEREFYFELINVPIPIFMLSPYIPAYNSFHPNYPFALAKDSRVTKNIETLYGRTITVTTTYQVLKPNVSLTGLSGLNIANVILENLPNLLPAQDVVYEPVTVEETLDYLYVKKSDEEYNQEYQAEVAKADLGNPDLVSRWKEVPFRTTSGTKLTGTRNRNTLKMSFWYFVESASVDEAELVTRYTGVVNNGDVVIAGRLCPAGTAKIESIAFTEHVWERPELELVYTMIQVVLLLDNKTWNKEYENVSNVFVAYPYEWEDSASGKENIKMKWDEETNQPIYDKDASNLSVQRIFCISYDPDPKIEEDDENEGDDIWVSDPQNAIQFFGTRDECFRLNPDSEPTEVSEPMYLDENGFVLYPDPDTGKVDPALSPKVSGYTFEPVDFTPLCFPVR